jgi:hypothetical protein
VHEQQLLFEPPLTRYYNYKSVSYTIFSKFFFNHSIEYRSSSGSSNSNSYEDYDDNDDTKIHANDADYAFNKLHNYIREIECKLSKFSIFNNSHGDYDDHRSRRNSNSSTIDNYRSGIDQLYLSSPISINIVFYNNTDYKNENDNNNSNNNSHHEIKANRNYQHKNNTYTLQATPSSLSSTGSSLSLSWFPSICFPHSLLAFIISPLLSEGFILDDYITSLKDMHLESSISGMIVSHSIITLLSSYYYYYPLLLYHCLYSHLLSHLCHLLNYFIL